MKKILITIILFVISSTSFAIPLGLQDYSLLSTRGNTSITNGSGVSGNIGSSNTLTIDSTATIYGDVFYGNLLDNTTTIQSPYTANQNADSNYWNSLYEDISAASSTAGSMTADLSNSFSNITENTVLNGTGSTEPSVFNISGNIDLGNGDTLTLSGSASDQFIINVDDGATFGLASSIVLDGGVTANHILFNIKNGDLEGLGGTKLFGTFLLPSGNLNLSGGANLIGSVLTGGAGTDNISSGSMINMSISPGTSGIPYTGPTANTILPELISEPSPLFMILLGLIGLSVIIRMRKTIYYL
ncbi:choice-of-anchor A family protein [Candidatus Nitrosacidococcus tergens]|uniref:PEP-CTERM protein-sorting domain-containing protein n=1 Tax=Candidatus Nitrosacidococcus tergens TaxID=553981 RepID=A0A7G1Q7C7_9GAMM|nr:choice-of-anchor A family protein [Candidatus Nitrosacidococcus tergens]CAB1274251.1 exported protein of unknown function [Candidatus Nitrosacidococcus tergens]